MESVDETTNKIVSFKTLKHNKYSKLDSIVSTNAHNKIEMKKERSKRVITETKRWIFSSDELKYSNQLLLLNSISYDSLIRDCISIRESLTKDKYQNMIYSQIKAKLRSYKEQDIKKNKYEPSKFVTVEFILDKLKECSMICFYCKEPTNILYEYVREPKQWTIERLDNTYGHNCGNIVIACLSCNLRRRTVHFERYLSTKHICAGIIKLDENKNDTDG